MIIMSWYCLTLITVLVSVICGNRFVNNRLLRSSYTGDFKSLNDINTDSLNNNKFNGDSKSKTLDTNSKPMDVPCGSEYDFKHITTARNCNDNIISLLKTPPNYITYENEDSTASMRDSFAQSARDFDDIFEVATPLDTNDADRLKPLLSSLPLSNYKDFYTDLVVDTTTKEEMMKRSGNTIGSSHGTPSARGCECKVRNDLMDLGQHYYPRYLLNAVCQSEQSRHQFGPKCWSGSLCRPLEYKVKVLTFRTLVDTLQNDPTMAWLPDDLRQIWKFKTVTVTAGCFCS